LFIYAKKGGVEGNKAATKHMCTLFESWDAGKISGGPTSPVLIRKGVKQVRVWLVLRYNGFEDPGPVAWVY
jgi:hypothetical protein